MKKIIIFLLIALLMFFAGCTKESPVIPSADLVVVRAYLYAGEPVSDVQLTQTLPLGSQETKRRR